MRVWHPLSRLLHISISENIESDFALLYHPQDSHHTNCKKYTK